VSTKAHPLDPAFVEKQRRTLTKLRATLLTAARDDEADEAEIKDESAGGAREHKEDAHLQRSSSTVTSSLATSRAWSELTGL
jgi:hypothetical protein